MVDRSLIAGANAWFRAAESQRNGSRILSDPWAIHLAERDPRIQAIRFARFALPPLRREIASLQAAHCARHAAVDALTLRAVDDGYRQLVIVGAGYDMRASRFSERLSGVRVFEVDHPATQARKVERLSNLPGVAPVARVAADLANEDLADALERVGWDRAIPTCFVAEGFVHYLTLHRFEALLASTARAARRRVVLSFIRTDMYLHADALFIQLIKAVREIPRLHFAPDDLRAVFARHGLGAFRTWRVEQQIEDLVPQAAGRGIVLSQDLAQGEGGA